jgi:hypothetical protein
VTRAGKPRKSVGTYSFTDLLFNPRILFMERAVDQVQSADLAAVQGGETRRVSCFLRGSSAPYPRRLRQGSLDISTGVARWTPFWSVRRRPVPVYVVPTHIRTRRPDRREWNVGRTDVFVVITCVVDAHGSRQETDLVVPAADAPLVTAYLNGVHRSRT